MSPHLKRTVYCTSGPIQIIKVEPFGRGNWVAWEVKDDRTGEVRHPATETECLLTFNELLIQINENQHDT